MIWNFKKFRKHTALISDYEYFTYDDLYKGTKSKRELYGKENLIYFKAHNDIHSVYDYLTLINAGNIIILVNEDIDKEIHDKYIRLFQPAYVYENRVLNITAYEKTKVNKKLRLLMPTSGSTGDSKFVKISEKNIKAGMNSIKDFLHLDTSENAALTLPMSYIFGLSIIHSHMAAGGAISLFEDKFYQKGFWDNFNKYQCTSFSNVTYGFVMLQKFGFDRTECPTLRYFSHSGGAIPDKMLHWYRNYCEENNVDFYAMYGSTETSGRMTYLGPDDFFSLAGTVGKPVPGGSISIEDGEVVYRGKNVSMGYAYARADLITDDVNKGCYKTGDIGLLDCNDNLYLIGRKSRFTKQLGYRYSLDGIEQTIERLYDCECAAVEYNGKVYLYLDKEIKQNNLIFDLNEKSILLDRPHIVSTGVPHNKNGKKDYKIINEILRRGED